MNANYVCRIVGCVAIATCVCGLYAKDNSSDVPINKDSKKIDDNAPGEVLKLSRWPDQSVLSGASRLSGDSPEVVFAKNQTNSWSERVLAPTWLPPEGTQVYFLQNEFDGRDVVRMKWQCNNYEVVMSQTASIFLIKLTPLNSCGTGVDGAAKLAFARDLVLKVFKETGRRWSTDSTGAGVEVPVPDLAKKITSYSFVPGTARSLEENGVVVGRPKTMEEEGVQKPATDEDQANERKANNPNWEKSSLSWRYWFRQIHWWNDGHSVTIYFLKVEEGAWLPTFGDNNIDKGFLKISEGKKAGFKKS